MNIYRFFGIPNAFKIAEFLLTILLVLTVGFSEGSHPGAWFFWLNVVLQLISLIVIICVFLMEIENSLTCGRNSWPLFEMSYSALFFLFNIINTFICGSWARPDARAVVAGACFSFILLLLYSLGGVMMFRIWAGFTSATDAPTATATNASPASPPPTLTTVATGSVRPGDTGNMHPGV